MKPIPRRPLFPLITDLLEYQQAANNTIPYTKKMVEKYGDVCDVSFTGVRNYFIHDPEVIKEILNTQSLKFKRTYLFRAFRKFLGQGLFTSDGEFHKQQRKLIKPAFYPQRITNYASIMVQCASDEINTWKDGQIINVNQAMTRITLNVITKTLFGSQLNDELIGFVGRKLAEAFIITNRICSNPFYVYCLDKEIRIPLIVRFFEIKSELYKVIDRIISEYRTDNKSGGLDLLSMLMEAKDEDSKTGMTDEQVRDEVMTFLIAGHETTTIALTWTWYLLGKSPDIALKLQEEVNSILAGRLPTADDYQSLHLTKNIFRESLRLYPPAWTFAREAIEDVVLNGYHFPKGSVLWTVTYLLHHSEKYFYKPEEFIPGRWDEEKINDLPKYAYFPFGGGNRMCIGEGFAWMEGVLVLATIASRFQLKFENDFSTVINPLFSLKTKEQVMMTVRSQPHNATGENIPVMEVISSGAR